MSTFREKGGLRDFPFYFHFILKNLNVKFVFFNRCCVCGPISSLSVFMIFSVMLYILFVHARGCLHPIKPLFLCSPLCKHPFSSIVCAPAVNCSARGSATVTLMSTASASSSVCVCVCVVGVLCVVVCACAS